MDTQKQRILGTDIADCPPKKETMKKAPPKAKPKWKEKHEEFVNNIRYAREAQAAEARGETIAPPPPAQKPSDHVLCPTCGRTFNPTSAVRHLEFCAEQAKRKPQVVKGQKEGKVKMERMKNFKSTLDKKKSTERTEPAPAPYSRTLRDNKSAPTPSRGAPRGYSNNIQSDSDSEPEYEAPKYNKPPQYHRAATNINGRAQQRVMKETSPRVSSARGPPIGKPGSKNPPFCYNCGSKYPVAAARFCCECGTQKVAND